MIFGRLRRQSKKVIKMVACITLTLALSVYPYVPILNIALAQNTSETTSLETGDAQAISESEAIVNTTLIDSTITTETIITPAGDVDLNLPEPSPSESADSEGGSTQSIEIANEVAAVTTASAQVVTGDNTQEATESGQLAQTTTGDAVAVATAVTIANTSLVNSSLEVNNIVVAAPWEGDIVVAPMFDELEVTEQGSSQLNLTINNEGNVETSALATANSGNNTQIASGSGEITTGNAGALAQATSITNTTLINTDFIGLLVSNIHFWTGNILNFFYPGSVTSAQELWYGQTGTTGCPENGCVSELGVENDLDVSTLAIASANTGDNRQNSGGDAILTTGNAYAIASATTIANSTLINSRMRIYQLLLMAPWTGDFVFAYPTEEAIDTQEMASVPFENTKSEESGKVEVPVITLSSKNNVGEYIYPGDGVRYEIVVNNQGPIDVQDAILVQSLLAPDGSLIRQVSGYVGSIALNRSRTISFILNTAAKMAGGVYTTQSYVVAKTDRGIDVISNTAQNQIPLRNRKLKATAANEQLLEIAPQTKALENGEVLGTTTAIPTCGECVTWPWYLAVAAGSLVYFVTNLSRRNVVRAAKLGLIIPLTGYAGLLLSLPACHNGIFLNNTAPYWCQWFLLYGYGIYGATTALYGIMRAIKKH